MHKGREVAQGEWVHSYDLENWEYKDEEGKIRTVTISE